MSDTELLERLLSSVRATAHQEIIGLWAERDALRVGLTRARELLASTEAQVASLIQQREALKRAAAALYYAAHWKPDRLVDEAKLWSDLRDAAGFEPGNAPEPA
jgi:hypothetical protein